MRAARADFGQRVQPCVFWQVVPQNLTGLHPQVIEQVTETFYRRPLFVRAMEEEEAPRRRSHFVGQQNCSTQGYNWHQR